MATAKQTLRRMPGPQRRYDGGSRNGHTVAAAAAMGQTSSSLSRGFSPSIPRRRLLSLRAMRASSSIICSVSTCGAARAGKKGWVGVWVAPVPGGVPWQPAPAGCAQRCSMCARGLDGRAACGRSSGGGGVGARGEWQLPQLPATVLTALPKSASPPSMFVSVAAMSSSWLLQVGAPGRLACTAAASLCTTRHASGCTCFCETVRCKRRVPLATRLLTPPAGMQWHISATWQVGRCAHALPTVNARTVCALPVALGYLILVCLLYFRHQALHREQGRGSRVGRGAAHHHTILTTTPAVWLHPASLFRIGKGRALRLPATHRTAPPAAAAAARAAWAAAAQSRPAES